MLPSLADVLALESVRRGAPRVLVGADQLDVQVRWVHVIELAEADHLLRGGELVLSTGIALPPDPAGLSRYVAGLAAAGVSALAVELGRRYVRELPRALVAAAAAQQLPLIVLERETRFVAVTEAVHAQILQAQIAEMQAAERLRRVFTGLAVSGAGQDEIVRQASELAQAPVILADLAHRVLACAPAGRDPVLLLDGFTARSRLVTMPGRLGYDEAAGWLLASVGTRDADWGRLIVVLGAPPDPAASALAEQAASTLALARLTSGSRETPERVAHRALLDAITGPRFTEPDELTARITALGIPVAGRRLLPVVVALSGDSGSFEAVADAIAVVCHEIRVPVTLAALDHRRIAALLVLPAGADADATAARLASGLRVSALEPADAVGVGAPVLDIGDARRGLSEADAVAGAVLSQAGISPGPSGDAGQAGAPGDSRAGHHFARMSDVGLAGLLYQLRDDPRLQAFAELELGALLRHDQIAGSTLMPILEAFLSCGGNKAAAALQTGLARPTLYERLRQIEQALGVSLDTAESRLALHAALVARAVTR
jgi:PucR family transcriptional regulator, purine catabolism regulatory protein